MLSRYDTDIPKAYFQLPNANPAKAITFLWTAEEDNEATGINTVAAEDDNVDAAGGFYKGNDW